MYKKIGSKFIYTDKDGRKHQLLTVEDAAVDCSKCFFGDGTKVAHPCKTSSRGSGSCTSGGRLDGKYINFILLRSQRIQK